MNFDFFKAILLKRKKAKRRGDDLITIAIAIAITALLAGGNASFVNNRDLSVAQGNANQVSARFDSLRSSAVIGRDFGIVSPEKIVFTFTTGASTVPIKVYNASANISLDTPANLGVFRVQMKKTDGTVVDLPAGTGTATIEISIIKPYGEVTMYRDGETYAAHADWKETTIWIKQNNTEYGVVISKDKTYLNTL